MTGTWVLPTLNRPYLLKQFFKSYKESEGSTPGIVLIDKGDFIANQQKYQEIELPEGWKIVETVGVTMGDKVREIWSEIENLDWVGILNDDHRPITKEWDKKIVGQINGFNIVGTNDGLTPDKPWQAGNKLAGGICYSGKILRAIGWMFPPGMNHLYHDDVWGFLASRAGIGQILMDVCVHHDHAYIHKQEDDTHKKVNAPESWKHDSEVYQKWMKEESNKDLLKIIAILPKQGVMICTPCHDGDAALDFGVGLMDVGIALNGYNIHFEFARVDGSSLIPHARNSLVNMFLSSKCQRLLFIDSDHGFNRNHVLQLLQSNRKIIAGLALHKRFPHNLNFEPLPEDNHFFENLTNKNEADMFKLAKAKNSAELEVNRAGTGFMMIDRSVFEILQEDSELKNYKAFDDRDDMFHHEYFKMGASQDDSRYHGEDWFFCYLAKKNNIPIYIHTNVCVTHKGTYVWRIDEAKRLA